MLESSPQVIGCLPTKGRNISEQTAGLHGKRPALLGGPVSKPFEDSVGELEIPKN